MAHDCRNHPACATCWSAMAPEGTDALVHVPGFGPADACTCSRCEPWEGLNAV